MGESETKAKRRHLSGANKRRNDKATRKRSEQKAKELADWVLANHPKTVRKFTDTFVSVLLGSGNTRILPLGRVKQLIGARNGGVIVQRKGTGFRWNSASARKAVSKRWKRHKKSRSGYRLGESLVHVKRRLDLAAIRRKHSTPLYAGVWFNCEPFNPDKHVNDYWVEKRAGDATPHHISERTALAILGYHKRTRSQNTPVKILARVVNKRSSSR